MAGKSIRLIANNFNRVSLLLAEALTLGCWTEAEWIANAIRFALAERRRDRGQVVCGFREVERTSVAPFVLHLYAQWSVKPFPMDNLPLRSMQAYEPLLSLWQTEELEALEKVLNAACDFHMERSNTREHNTPEFGTSTDILYPVEILAILRLRQKEGLPNPVVNHPLMQTPIG